MNTRTLYHACCKHCPHSKVVKDEMDITYLKKDRDKVLKPKACMCLLAYHNNYNRYVNYEDYRKAHNFNPCWPYWNSELAKIYEVMPWGNRKYNDENFNIPKQCPFELEQVLAKDL